MPSALDLYGEYDRKAVRDILAPHEPFTVGAGNWGLKGIIRLPEGGFALFATYGQSTGGHTFDEGISTEGVLRWQSMPSQRLDTPMVQQLISHESAGRDVHLFLRTRASRGIRGIEPYTYLGTVAYRSHDGQRERPVHIAWSLLAWPIPDDVRERMGLVLDAEEDRETIEETAKLSPGLTPIPIPPGSSVAETTHSFQARKGKMVSEARLKEIGLVGETLVLAHEIARLNGADRSDLAAAVRHVSVLDGDGAGYDIRSFNADGSNRFIEVKTTTGPAETPFPISANEVAFSQHAGDAFALCRLANLDMSVGAAEYFELSGPIDRHFALQPIQFRALLIAAEANRGDGTPTHDPAPRRTQAQA